RVVVSVTSSPDSDDMATARNLAATDPSIEVICTGRELPTMQHQAFWVSYLEDSGLQRDDWIYWLAYDDQVRLTGIEALVDADGNWPLEPRTAYFGPWAMRHEQSDSLYGGPWDEPLESWTSFPIDGPLRLKVADWVGRQLAHPTYMQMSGSVCAFENYLRLRDSRPRKSGPMRIEMATAAAPPNTHVAEFATPVSIVYGRPNSDRASYGKAARREDVHLAAWLIRQAFRDPAALPRLAAATGRILDAYGRLLWLGEPLPNEDWVVRGLVAP
ncbi:MAG: hypothetical protein ACYC0W_04695, partial [Candidatus Nanopelagicales bacterium]